MNNNVEAVLDLSLKVIKLFDKQQGFEPEQLSKVEYQYPEIYQDNIGLVTLWQIAERVTEEGHVVDSVISTPPLTLEYYFPFPDEMSDFEERTYISVVQTGAISLKKNSTKLEFESLAMFSYWLDI